MNALITYDVSNKQPEVKKGMKDLKYWDYWTANNKSYYLPNTTLWKKDTTLAGALSDIKKVIETINHKITAEKDKIKLERCITVYCDNWDGMPGDKHFE